jgi:hypothetical protein
MGYTITSLGSVAGVRFGYNPVQSNVGVLFNGKYVFTRRTSSSAFVITAFDLTAKTFSDVWSSAGKGLPNNVGDFVLTVIDGTLYFGVGWETASSYPYEHCKIYTTTNLSSWSDFLTSDSVNIEAIAKFTGGGTYNNDIFYAGYNTVGGGTYAAVRCWHNGAEVNIFDGTSDGSDDACFLAMFDTVKMISGDCAPSNVIYSDDSHVWHDEYDDPNASSTYPFCWGWDVEVVGGKAFIVEESSIWVFSGQSYFGGGILVWSGVGTATPKKWSATNSQLETIANGLAGGSDGLFSRDSPYYTGHPSIYEYASDGSQGTQVYLNASITGVVRGLKYNASTSTWYALMCDVVGNSITLISIVSIPSGQAPTVTTQDATDIVRY